MNKRKLQINQVKKTALRGKKQNSINTKYEVALSYFKQKDQKIYKIFTITFQPLITDLIEQLSNVELAYKLENEIKQQIQPIEVTDQQLKFEASSLKYVSKQFPIQQIVECFSIKKNLKKKQISLQITKNKLMLFFKHIRSIYSEFCSCGGQKVIVDNNDLRAFYECFKVEWGKNNQRGRMHMTQKIQKLICRSLYFIGALVQNNIFIEIDQQQRKKKQQNSDFGTKSEKKRNVKGITHQVSSTYSFGSNDMLSNFSYGFPSQHSNEQDYNKSGYSQKSQKIIRKQRCSLWDKGEIKNLKIKLPIDHIPANNQTRYQIDLLSNDVQNILIEQAFKIQKLKDACQRNRFDNMLNPYQYQFDPYLNYYNNQPLIYHQSYGNNYYNNSNNSNNFYYQQSPQIQNYQHSYINQNMTSEDSDLYQLRRSYNLNNFVETRKTHSRMGGNKYS